jgi:hypothetical protein
VQLNTTINRPSITVGFKWIEAAFPFKDHADDVKVFNDLRTQHRKVQALVKDLNGSLTALREQSKQAHAELAANPGEDTIAKAEEHRLKLASSEVETKRSIEQLQTTLLQTVRAKLPSIAARLHKAIGEWLIKLSSDLEQKEKALAAQYEASGFVPSEIVRALVYRASSFYDAARTQERGIISNISNPDSAMLALPPENVAAPTKK